MTDAWPVRCPWLFIGKCAWNGHTCAPVFAAYTVNADVDENECVLNHGEWGAWRSFVPQVEILGENGEYGWKFTGLHSMGSCIYIDGDDLKGFVP